MEVVMEVEGVKEMKVKCGDGGGGDGSGGGEGDESGGGEEDESEVWRWWRW